MTKSWRLEQQKLSCPNNFYTDLQCHIIRITLEQPAGR